MLANAAYQAGLQFYDALLPEVTTEDNRGRIGGIGVGVGYLGSYLAVGIGFLIPSNIPAAVPHDRDRVLRCSRCRAFSSCSERGNPQPAADLRLVA